MTLKEKYNPDIFNKLPVKAKDLNRRNLWLGISDFAIGQYAPAAQAFAGGKPSEMLSYTGAIPLAGIFLI